MTTKDSTFFYKAYVHAWTSWQTRYYQYGKEKEMEDWIQEEMKNGFNTMKYSCHRMNPNNSGGCVDVTIEEYKSDDQLFRLFRPSTFKEAIVYHPGCIYLPSAKVYKVYFYFEAQKFNVPTETLIWNTRCDFDLKKALESKS